LRHAATIFGAGTRKTLKSENGQTVNFKKMSAGHRGGLLKNLDTLASELAQCLASAAITDFSKKKDV
jgi:hypothetical protein